MNIVRHLGSALQAFKTEQVYLERVSLDGLPSLRDLHPLRIVRMDYDNPSDVNGWLNIMNQSFDRSWSPEDFRPRIPEHPHYQVPRTYFLMDGERYVSAVSEAYFRRAPHIGVTHYLGIDRAYLGRGLGQQMILYAVRQIAERGDADRCEMETSLTYKASILIHFGLGFQPKFKNDPWNTPDSAPWPKRVITRLRYRRMWQDFLRARG